MHLAGYCRQTHLADLRDPTSRTTQMVCGHLADIAWFGVPYLAISLPNRYTATIGPAVHSSTFHGDSSKPGSTRYRRYRRIVIGSAT
jgi:hypothetical protein